MEFASRCESLFCGNPPQKTPRPTGVPQITLVNKKDSFRRGPITPLLGGGWTRSQGPIARCVTWLMLRPGQGRATPGVDSFRGLWCLGWLRGSGVGFAWVRHCFLGTLRESPRGRELEPAHIRAAQDRDLPGLKMRELVDTCDHSATLPRISWRDETPLFFHGLRGSLAGFCGTREIFAKRYRTIAFHLGATFSTGRDRVSSCPRRFRQLLLRRLSRLVEAVVALRRGPPRGVICLPFHTVCTSRIF